ncbi:unnamed protein product [Didymodactylos carnosus]|uniref:Transmembrane protein 231 n=1 Tax=Didymodactylos carnosus TaxID=1234261 RepID=A0A8S2VJ86_9BILA|nr:unnamed protein product [Didymodactylos carnosus]CAF4388696.1 unnamed protein product [Didymodactylos carnosus]
MTFYEIYSHPVRRHYKAYILSLSTFVLIVVAVLTFLSPFLVAYFTGEFWWKELNYSEQPRITYTNKYILLLQSNSGVGSFSSSYTALNTAFQSVFSNGYEICSVEDTDNDGIIDQWKIVLSVPLADSSTSVSSLNAWIFFNYSLHGRQSIAMETLALVSLTSPSSTNTNNVTVYGQLVFEQRQPIQSNGNDLTLNTPIVTFNNGVVPAFNTILENYFTRSYYTTFKQQYTSWSLSSETERFTVTVVINVGRQSIRFTPGFWQEFKWGWIQYLTILLPFLFVFSRIKEFVFTNQLVKTICSADNRHKA